MARQQPARDDASGAGRGARSSMRATPARARRVALRLVAPWKAPGCRAVDGLRAARAGAGRGLRAGRRALRGRRAVGLIGRQAQGRRPS